MHVDMDAYYISVDLLDNLLLKNQPAASYQKGMILSANYAARELGIKSGPISSARYNCPNIALFKCDLLKY